jgi:hypothetical protein
MSDILALRIRRILMDMMIRQRIAEIDALITILTGTMMRLSQHLRVYVDSILIFGPGEAKGELQKRLENQEAKWHIVAVEASDKMTDGQIVAEVREYFHG